MYLKNSQPSRDLPIPPIPRHRHEEGLALSLRSRGTAPSTAATPARGRRTAPPTPPSLSAPRLTRSLPVAPATPAQAPSLPFTSYRRRLVLPPPALSPAASPHPRRPSPDAPRTADARRIDEISGHHPFPLRAQRHRRLTAQYTARARSSEAPTSSPSACTAATSSSAARTARSASSSGRYRAPHTAITASPMNFSTVPPYQPVRRRHVSK